MNILTLIETLNTLDLNNHTAVQQFLQLCEKLYNSLNSWISETEIKYSIQLSQTTKKSLLGESQTITLSDTQLIISALASHFSYYSQLYDKKVDIDKLKTLASQHRENPALTAVRDAACYHGMSMQSYQVDAEGGEMSVNAHSHFARIREGSVQGQIINRIILPGIRQLTEEYTSRNRYLFFSKAHTSLAKEMERDILLLYFLGNFQLYVTKNHLDISVTNQVYQEDSSEEIVSKRTYIDNTKNLYNKLYQCLKYYEEELNRRNSIELKRKLQEMIFTPVAQALQREIKIDDREDFLPK